MTVLTNSRQSASQNVSLDKYVLKQSSQTPACRPLLHLIIILYRPTIQYSSICYIIQYHLSSRYLVINPTFVFLSAENYRHSTTHRRNWKRPYKLIGNCSVVLYSFEIKQKYYIFRKIQFFFVSRLNTDVALRHSHFKVKQEKYGIACILP